MLTIVIRTLNEEVNIRHCLTAACASFEDVVVVDQRSTDKTLEICSEFPAKVVTSDAFASEAQQLQWIERNIPSHDGWIYFCDADEIIPPELARELKAETAQAAPAVAAYSLCYKNFFCGRWIRHCGIYPVWVTRLFRVGRVRWERLTNTRALVDGETHYLKEHFEHYSFRKGIESWVEKHNRYSSGEAQEEVKKLGEAQGTQFVADAARRLMHRHERRQALKQLASALPARPAFRFLYMYVLKRGFLDGQAGFHYCMLLSFYEYLIALKRRELLRPPFGR
jgi:glycosyltransferase involved in cell wall biosynthesis